jgi:myosin heavy subunit
VKKTSSGEILEFNLGEDEVELDGLKLMNEKGKNDVDNLINLQYLHEPAILHSLQIRYNAGYIYTSTGPILIALNPFKQMDFYDTQVCR